MILAIDPGPTESAWVLWSGILHNYAKEPNDKLLAMLALTPATECWIEKIASYGMAVGAEVFETCYWTGRFAQAFSSVRVRGMDHVSRIERGKIKGHLCHDSRANDSNIRQAIIDRFGGKEKAIGRKATPGLLHGVTGDCWSALAVALYAHDHLKGAAA